MSGLTDRDWQKTGRYSSRLSSSWGAGEGQGILQQCPECRQTWWSGRGYSRRRDGLPGLYRIKQFTLLALRFIVDIAATGHVQQELSAHRQSYPLIPSSLVR